MIVMGRVGYNSATDIPSCARTASGHAAAAPPTRVTKSRRLIGPLRSAERLLHRALAVWELDHRRDRAMPMPLLRPMSLVGPGRD